MTWVSYEKHIWLIGGWSWIPFQGRLLLVLGRFFWRSFRVHRYWLGVQQIFQNIGFYWKNIYIKIKSVPLTCICCFGDGLRTLPRSKSPWKITGTEIILLEFIPFASFRVANPRWIVFFLIFFVDGKNPAPPEMYENLWNHRINYQPQVVNRISAIINSMVQNLPDNRESFKEFQLPFVRQDWPPYPRHPP